jgi:hypothetical protein
VHIQVRDAMSEKLEDLRFDSINSWDELVTVEEVFWRRRKEQEWVFRGQPSVDQLLKPSLERECERLGLTGSKVSRVEKALITDFVRSYHLYGGTASPGDDDTLEWLALMRHHGAPTRLLDFSFSFFMATFFALEHAEDAKDSRIWAINKTWLTEETRKIVKRQILGGESVWEQFNKLRAGVFFRAIYMRSEDPLQTVGPVGPFRLNQRLVLQQGLFLCPADLTTPFQNMVDGLSNSQRNVLRLTIKATCRDEIMRKLHRAGINRSTLFPGLDGFAHSLRTKMLILSELKDMEASQSRKQPNVDDWV